MLKPALFIVITITLIYLMVVLFMYLYQRKLLYYPDKVIFSPKHYGLDFAEIKLTTFDDVEITAWRGGNKKSKKILVYFHGNAGHLGDRAADLQSFAKRGFVVYALSYRGYGSSAGVPTEKGIYADARALLNFIGNHQQTTIYGESLGSGVAIEMAKEFKINAIILEAPYTKIADRAQELYPYLPVRLLLKDRFASIEKISDLDTDILILHGSNDQVMPIKFGKKLFKQAEANNKYNRKREFVVFENAGHTHENVEEISQIVWRFISAD